MATIDWSLRGLDLIGIGLGIIGIGISIGIFIKQSRTSKNVDQLHDATILFSLERIRYSLTSLKDSINRAMRNVDSSSSDDEIRMIVARETMKEENEYCSEKANDMMREAGFLKGRIDPLTQREIEGIAYVVVKDFLNNPALSGDFGSSRDTLQVWLEAGQDIIVNIDSLLKGIEGRNPLNAIRKSSFRAKGYQ